MPFTGLTEDGLEVPTGNEWLQFIRESINDRADEDLPFTENDLLGSLTVEMAFRLAQLSGALKAVDNQRSVQTASGAHLEDLTSIVGVDRQPGRPSRVSPQRLIGDFRKVIDAGTRLKGGGPDDELIWQTQKEVELGLDISPRETVSELDTGLYELDLIIDNRRITLSTNLTNAGDSKELLDAFQQQIQLSRSAGMLSTELRSWTTRKQSGSYHDDLSYALVVRSTKGFDLEYIVQSDPNSGANTGIQGDRIQKGAAYTSIEATENGPYTANFGQIDSIIDNVSGLDTTENLVKPAVGTFVDSDRDLRQAHGQRLQRNATASADSIRAQVQELNVLESALVIENDVDNSRTVNGMELAPSSIGVVVWPDGLSSSDLDEIASVIYDNLAHGIETTEDTTNFVPSDRLKRTVETSGQTTKDIFFHYAQRESTDITITAEIEQQFSRSDLRTRIEQSISSYFASLDVGEDVRRLELFGTIDDIPPVRGVSRLEVDGGSSDKSIDAISIAFLNNINFVLNYP